MVNSSDWQGFLARFCEFGREPTSAHYLDLFDQEGTVLHPGMVRPIAGDEIKTFFDAALSTMPDFRLRPVYWCARGEDLFVEAALSGTVQGSRIAWPALYCLTLRRDRVLRGRSYYDRAAVLSRLEPHLAGRQNEAHAYALADKVPGSDQQNRAHHGQSAIRTELIEPYIANWWAPRPEHFVKFYALNGRLLVPGVPGALSGPAITDYFRTQFTQAPDLRLRCEIWAQRSGQVFFEWQATGTIGGRALELGAAERLTLDGGGIVEAVSYFDTLSLHPPDDPAFGSRTVFQSSN